MDQKVNQLTPVELLDKSMTMDWALDCAGSDVQLVQLELQPYSEMTMNSCPLHLFTLRPSHYRRHPLGPSQPAIL